LLEFSQTTKFYFEYCPYGLDELEHKIALDLTLSDWRLITKFKAKTAQTRETQVAETKKALAEYEAAEALKAADAAEGTGICVGAGGASGTESGAGGSGGNVDGAEAAEAAAAKAKAKKKAADDAKAMINLHGFATQSDYVDFMSFIFQGVKPEEDLGPGLGCRLTVLVPIDATVQDILRAARLEIGIEGDGESAVPSEREVLRLVDVNKSDGRMMVTKVYDDEGDETLEWTLTDIRASPFNPVSNLSEDEEESRWCDGDKV